MFTGQPLCVLFDLAAMKSMTMYSLVTLIGNSFFSLKAAFLSEEVKMFCFFLTCLNSLCLHVKMPCGAKKSFKATIKMNSGTDLNEIPY